MLLKIEGSNKLHMQVGDKVCMSSMHASSPWSLAIINGLQWMLDLSIFAHWNDSYFPTIVET